LIGDDSEIELLEWDQISFGALAKKRNWAVR